MTSLSNLLFFTISNHAINRDMHNYYISFFRTIGKKHLTNVVDGRRLKVPLGMMFIDFRTFSEICAEYLKPIPANVKSRVFILRGSKRRRRHSSKNIGFAKCLSKKAAHIRWRWLWFVKSRQCWQTIWCLLSSTNRSTTSMSFSCFISHSTECLDISAAPRYFRWSGSATRNIGGLHRQTCWRVNQKFTFCNYIQAKRMSANSNYLKSYFINKVCTDRSTWLAFYRRGRLSLNLSTCSSQFSEFMKHRFSTYDSF